MRRHPLHSTATHGTDSTVTMEHMQDQVVLGNFMMCTYMAWVVYHGGARCMHVFCTEMSTDKLCCFLNVCTCKFFCSALN